MPLFGERQCRGRTALLIASASDPKALVARPSKCYLGFVNQPLRALHPSETPARFSVDEFMEFVATGVLDGTGKVELVEGVIVRMSPALLPHTIYQRKLFLDLDAVFDSAGRNRTAQFELSLRLNDATLRVADIAVLDVPPLERRFADASTVLLIVEIADTSRERDLESKREDYARAGIPHYWVVDIEKRLVHMMTTPLDGDYATRKPAAFGEPLPVPETDRTIVVD